MLDQMLEQALAEIFVAVFVGDGERQVGVGQVDALAGRDRAAVDHPRRHAVRQAGGHPQLDHAVVDQHALIGP